MTAAHNIVLDMGNVLMTFDGMYFSRIFTDSEEDAQALYDGLYGQPFLDAERYKRLAHGLGNLGYRLLGEENWSVHGKWPYISGEVRRRY